VPVSVLLECYFISMESSQIENWNHLFVVNVVLNRPSLTISMCMSRRVWRYQRGNQNPYIEEEQTGQWPNEKVQKDKQRSTKHTHKIKDRVTRRTPLKTGGELRCSGRVSSSFSRRVNLATNQVISDEWRKDREVFTTSGPYPWSFVTQIFHYGQLSHGGDRKAFEVMTST